MRKVRSISLVYWASGSGIEKDIRVLERALGAAGHRLDHVTTRNRKSRVERIFKILVQLPRVIFKRDIQIHVEQIHREQFKFAKVNVLIPNPEITDKDLFRKIKDLPVVFCKSHRAVQLFEELEMTTRYIGFTSEDSCRKGFKKDFSKFLHVAGASNFKGTKVLLDVWSRHPEWPKLTIIRTLKDCYGNARESVADNGGENLEIIERWLPDEDLAEFQNSSGIHLCPSEMEGFGHYIVEALSVGSIVVTTDAPPMNELVDDSCGFRVRALHAGKSYMDDRWSVDPESLESCIQNILKMAESDLVEMGKAARLRYEKLNTGFPSNLLNAVDEL